METSLLTTKLNVPPKRPQLVQRPQLNERLQKGLSYKLVLVSAPAGFGKTTLLSEWIHGSEPRINTAWISLDEGDNDPVRFWDYFITALQTLKPECGNKILPLLHSSPQPSVEPILTEIINDLSTVSDDFVVILDDYHLIESEKIHEGITYLLEHLPAEMHLVLATRADPPLHLAHLRGRGEMLEIGADDLRFNPEDAANLLKTLDTPELTPEEVNALNERTEGWVVGLKMAALSMSGQKDISGFITAFTGSHRYVMDYLMEEVLQKQTTEIGEFLCKTSILKRLTAPLCDVITEKESSQDILHELERNHLFIVPLDEERIWYRYEHLFSDLLLHQCQTNYGMEHVTELHKKASHWYEENNLPEDAIYHSLVAEDWETAISLIYSHCEEMRKLAQFGTLLDWLNAIPEEILRTHHRLYSQYANYLTVFSQFDAAEAALTYLELATQDDMDLQGEVVFGLSNIARQRGDSARMVEMAKKALSLLPPDNITMRSRAAWQIGSGLVLGGFFIEAENWLTDAYKIGLQAAEHAVVSSALTYLSGIAHFRGNLHRAAEISKKGIGLAGQTQMATAPLSVLCKVHYELNALETAAENARACIEWGELGGIAEGHLITYFNQARIRLVQNDVVGATAAMAKMDETSRHPTVSRAYHPRHAACRVIFAIRQNDLEAATEWGRQLSEYSTVLFIEYQYAPGRLLIAQGKKKEASEYLCDLHERMVQAGAHGLDIAVRVCQALATDNEEEAIKYLSDALVKGEPEGFIRSFVDEGKLLVPLLEKALSNGVTPEYTRKLISIIESEERRKRMLKKGEISQSQSILSEREIEVLKLMAEGLSNQQIADRLIISPRTIKNHVHNILQKLDVRGRTQAAAQARELELI